MHIHFLLIMALFIVSGEAENISPRWALQKLIEKHWPS